MKEISIEEKARRYDEAIVKFDVILNLNTVKESGTIFADDVRKIFPELKESEDERIRKMQLDYWRSVGGKEWYGVPVQETIAWLEKQGSKKSVDELTQQGENKPTDKIEQMSIRSEDDKNTIKVLMNIIKKSEMIDPFIYTDSLKEKLYDWLKHLRPQNSIVTDEELAQAKNNAYNDALDKIEYHSSEPTFDDGWSAAIWYLKKRNAQPQNRWKPSEEMLEALYRVIPESVMEKSEDEVLLDKLYQGLKYGKVLSEKCK